MLPFPIIAIDHATSTVSSAREARTAPKPSRELAPVASLRAVCVAAGASRPRSAQQERGEQEGGRVNEVARVRPGGGQDRAAEDRPERHEAVDGEQEPVRLREVAVVDEVRQPRVDGRPEEAGREAATAASTTIASALGRRTAARGRRRGGRGRLRPSATGAEAVDERPGASPMTRIGRNSTMRARDPRAGLRAVVDVDDQRDDREDVPRPDEATRGRAGGSPGAAQQLVLAAQAAAVARSYSTGASAASASAKNAMLVGRADGDADRLGRPEHPGAARSRPAQERRRRARGRRRPLRRRRSWPRPARRARNLALEAPARRRRAPLPLSRRRRATSSSSSSSPARRPEPAPRGRTRAAPSRSR